jgi:hypothetical protein
MNLLDTRALPTSTDASDDASRTHGGTGAPSSGPRVRLLISAQLFAGFPEVQIVPK